MVSVKRRDFLLVFLVLFVVFIGLSEFLGDGGDLVVGHALTDVEACGCSTCHTVELTRCGGCHGSQPGKERSDESSPDPEEKPGSPPEEKDEPQGSPPDPDEPPGSEPDKPGDDVEEPGATPNKYQNQKGLR